MDDTVSETKACDILARLFKSRGFNVARNVVFREYGVEFHADGWDPRARVGFEFLSSEDDDHDDLTLTEYQALMAAQQRGELALFIIDEVEPLSASELLHSAEEFLDEVAEAGARGAARRRSPAPAGTRPAAPAKKRAPAKKPVRKQVRTQAKKRAKKKAATKKAAPARPKMVGRGKPGRRG